jgi:transposase
MRAGGEYFTSPVDPAQRRYEALRAYLVDGEAAEVAGARFGYSRATMYQMATDLRAGRVEFFVSSKPGPKGPRKTATLRERVLDMRAQDKSVKEIADALTAEGLPISHQSVWVIVSSEGLSRLPPRARRGHGPPPRTDAVRAGPLGLWPSGKSLECAHAGLFVLFPAMVELGVDQVIAAGGYPSTSVLSAWHSMASLLTLKLLRAGRVSHATSLAADEALGLAVGLGVLPKATHATTYSWRVRREMNTRALAELVRRLRPIGLATGDGGFNLDFHAIRHYGEDAPLDNNYVPKRSQATRSVLAFFAQDHASTEMVYANADVTKRAAATEILAFADHWKQTSGSNPGLLVFDSRLTTYAVLDELNGRSIDWLTLRQRGKAVLAELAALPASAWKTQRIDRAGRYRHPQLHEDVIAIKGIANPVRQIAVRNIGRDQPTPAHHQRHHHHGQGPVRPLRRAHAHRERAVRLHQGVPGRCPDLGPGAQRRCRHHLDRDRRQRLPPARPQPEALRARHPRDHPRAVHRHHRHHRRPRRWGNRHPCPAHLHPGPAAGRLRRAGAAHPLVGRPTAPVQVPMMAHPPASWMLQGDLWSENRG